MLFRLILHQFWAGQLFLAGQLLQIFLKCGFRDNCYELVELKGGQTNGCSWRWLSRKISSWRQSETEHFTWVHMKLLVDQFRLHGNINTSQFLIYFFSSLWSYPIFVFLTKDSRMSRYGQWLSFTGSVCCLKVHIITIFITWNVVRQRRRLFFAEISFQLFFRLVCYVCLLWSNLTCYDYTHKRCIETKVFYMWHHGIEMNS